MGFVLIEELNMEIQIIQGTAFLIYDNGFVSLSQVEAVTIDEEDDSSDISMASGNELYLKAAHGRAILDWLKEQQ